MREGYFATEECAGSPSVEGPECGCGCIELRRRRRGRGRAALEGEDGLEWGRCGEGGRRCWHRRAGRAGDGLKGSGEITWCRSRGHKIIGFSVDFSVMSSLISSVSWVRRGVSAHNPSKYVLDDAELQRVSALARIELEDAKVELERAHKAAQSMNQRDDDDDDDGEDEGSWVELVATFFRSFLVTDHTSK